MTTTMITGMTMGTGIITTLISEWP
jgi:hypothetical protein